VQFREIAGFGPYINFKIDAGYHRAGVPPTEDDLSALVKKTVELESQDLGKIHGVYTHSGHSYNGESPESGMEYLVDEIKGAIEGAKIVRNLMLPEADRRLVVSMGASPSSTSIQNLFGSSSIKDSHNAQIIRKSIQESFDERLSLELHAGVYTFMVNFFFRFHISTFLLTNNNLGHSTTQHSGNSF
jgi:D-serine ammonia-lyase